MSPEAQPAGYDTTRVEAWIAAHVDALRPPLRWRRLEGGHSNLTYLLEDADGRVAVIRRPPLGELLPKAHDMHREFSGRVIPHSDCAPTPERSRWLNGAGALSRSQPKRRAG